MTDAATMDEVARLHHILETQRLLASPGLDWQERFRIVTDRARAITSSDNAVLELLEGDEMVRRAVSGRAEGSVSARHGVAHTLTGRAARLGVSLCCADTELDSRVDRDDCRRRGVRSLAVVPLLGGSDRVGAGTLSGAVGVLEVASSEPYKFRPADLEVLQEMARFLTEAPGCWPISATGDPAPTS